MDEAVSILGKKARTVRVFLSSELMIAASDMAGGMTWALGKQSGAFRIRITHKDKKGQHSHL